MISADSALAQAFGMSPRHAEKLMEFCKGVYRRKRLLMIVRGANPAGLQWHGHPEYRPKPVWVKEKTGDDALLHSGGQTYYPDYDIHGLYELRDTSPPTYYRLFAGNYVNIDRNKPAVPRQKESPDQEIMRAFDKREPSLRGIDPPPIGSPEFSPFVKALNCFVCGEGPLMFQHGAQDGFLVSGRPILHAGDKFLVFEPTGNMFGVRNREDLKAYYRKHRISWPYVS